MTRSGVLHYLVAALTSPAAGWAQGLGGKYVIVMPFTAVEPARYGRAIR